jgi:hypothetical protein
MANPVPISISVASGTTAYVGRTRPLPSWIPPAGYFADIPMTNNPADVTPSGVYVANDMDAPFIQWGGSAILAGYSEYGAQIYRSAGHETAGGQPNIQTTLVCDFTTLQWKSVNNPVAANAASVFNQSTMLAPDGTAYAPHTYLGLQELPTAWGGGPKGSLMQFLWAGGSGVQNLINVMDVSQATHGYTQLATTQPQNSVPSKLSFGPNGTNSGGNYPVTVIDRVKQGWWLATDGTASYTLFVNKNGTVEQYPALGGNSQFSAIFLARSLNLLIVADGGYTAEASANLGMNPNVHKALYVMDLEALPSSSITVVLCDGQVPALRQGFDSSGDLNFHAPRQIGLEWVDELGAAYGLDDTTPGGPVLYKLTPPASNPKTANWAWSQIPLQHWSEGDPSGSSTLRLAPNTVHSKFRWNPALQAFVYATGKSVKPQVIKVS